MKKKRKGKDMKRGIELIAEERQRQIDVEGYSEQHDSQHKASTLIYAAIAYVESAKVGVNCAEMGNTNEHEIMMRKAEIGIHYPLGWAFKPSTDVRDLVKAGALIAAAIDRIQLAESQDEKIRKELLVFCRTLATGRTSVLANNIDFNKWISWIEKQGEKKLADKVEPKFKVGDWLIFNESHNRVYQVERIDNYRYYLRHYLGGTMSVHFDNELIRLWTLQSLGHQECGRGDARHDDRLRSLRHRRDQDT